MLSMISMTVDSIEREYIAAEKAYQQISDRAYKNWDDPEYRDAFTKMFCLSALLERAITYASIGVELTKEEIDEFKRDAKEIFGVEL